MAVSLDCTFTVTPSNGLGITSLSGAYVQNVFMHTSTTPAAGNSNPMTPGITVTNPNPANSNIIVQLQDNYNVLYLADFSIQSPNSGSALKIDNAALTAGAAYVITTLGDATTATWVALGVPTGITPAVGVAFIAASDGGSANVSTSRVQIAASTGSAVAAIEILGTPSTMISPTITSQGFGSSFILQCRDYAGALVAPVTGSVIHLRFLLSNSSVTIQGS